MSHLGWDVQCSPVPVESKMGKSSQVDQEAARIFEGKKYCMCPVEAQILFFLSLFPRLCGTRICVILGNTNNLETT